MSFSKFMEAAEIRAEISRFDSIVRALETAAENETRDGEAVTLFCSLTFALAQQARVHQSNLRDRLSLLEEQTALALVA